MIEIINHSDKMRHINYKPGSNLKDKKTIYDKHAREKTTTVNLEGFAKHKVVKNFDEEFII
jgi:hypothetical protein